MANDSISRQAALDAVRSMQTYKLHEGDNMLLVDKVEVQTELMTLPSAQPELIRCKDCVRYQTERCFMHIERLWELKPDDFCSQAERR